MSYFLRRTSDQSRLRPRNASTAAAAPATSAGIGPGGLDPRVERLASGVGERLHRVLGQRLRSEAILELAHRRAEPQLGGGGARLGGGDVARVAHGVTSGGGVSRPLPTSASTPAMASVTPITIAVAQPGPTSVAIVRISPTNSAGSAPAASSAAAPKKMPAFLVPIDLLQRLGLGDRDLGGREFARVGGELMDEIAHARLIQFGVPQRH